MTSAASTSRRDSDGQGFLGHHALRERLTFEASLMTETALHVGAGDSGDPMAGTDLPIARDGRGRPYVPGSSLRGAVRSRLEAVLRGLGRNVCDPFEKGDPKDPALSKNLEVGCSHRIAAIRKDLQSQGRQIVTEQEAFDLAWDNACEICSIFGHSFLGSRVRFADLPLEGNPDTYVRDGVGLDRDLRLASKGILYNFEAVPAGARFKLRLEIENADDHEKGLVLIGLDLLAQGFVTVGGKSARGLGQATLNDLTARLFRVEDFFRIDTRPDDGELGRVLEKDDLAAWRAAARTHYTRSANGGA